MKSRGERKLRSDPCRGMGGGVLNMMGGLSSAGMIYMAGIWKDTIGFAGMVVWMMGVSLLAAVVLVAVTVRWFSRDSVLT